MYFERNAAWVVMFDPLFYVVAGFWSVDREGRLFYEVTSILEELACTEPDAK